MPADKAISTLTAALTAAATSFTVADGSKFLTTIRWVGIDAEIIKVTRSGNIFTVLSGGRGSNGTTAAAHIVGAEVRDIIVSDDFPGKSYTTAGKPAATAVPIGTEIWVTDATAGQEHQISDGSTWKYIARTVLS